MLRNAGGELVGKLHDACRVGDGERQCIAGQAIVEALPSIAIWKGVFRDMSDRPVRILSEDARHVRELTGNVS